MEKKFNKMCWHFLNKTAYDFMVLLILLYQNQNKDLDFE